MLIFRSFVPHYWLQFGDREVALPDGELLIGRSVGCHLRLTCPSVSRLHLRLLSVGKSISAYDLDSRNGTWVNNTRLTDSVSLKDGDQLRVGTQIFTIREGPSTDHEIEQDTWEIIFEPTPPVIKREDETIIDPSMRRTLELDKKTIDMAERKKVSPPITSEGFSLGHQICGICGASFELGLPSCPYCSASSYSAPKYRSCSGCKALLSESDEFCSKCGLSRQKALAEDDSDRRQDIRHPTALSGLYVSSSLTFEADIINISKGGLFIVAELLDPIGTMADIVLAKEHIGKARFSGEVVHVVADPINSNEMEPGMGIRFTELEPSANSWLRSFLKAKNNFR